MVSGRWVDRPGLYGAGGRFALCRPPVSEVGLQMPIFVYRSKDGEEREVFFNSTPPPQFKVIDGEPFQRLEVQPFAFVGQAPKPCMGQEVMRGYREQEIVCGSRFHSKLHHETVKRAWANDASDEQ